MYVVSQELQLLKGKTLPFFPMDNIIINTHMEQPFRIDHTGHTIDTLTGVILKEAPHATVSNGEFLDAYLSRKDGISTRLRLHTPKTGKDLQMDLIISDTSHMSHFESGRIFNRYEIPIQLGLKLLNNGFQHRKVYVQEFPKTDAPYVFNYFMDIGMEIIAFKAKQVSEISFSPRTIVEEASTQQYGVVKLTGDDWLKAIVEKSTDLYMPVSFTPSKFSYESFQDIFMGLSPDGAHTGLDSHLGIDIETPYNIFPMFFEDLSALYLSEFISDRFPEAWVAGYETGDQLTGARIH